MPRDEQTMFSGFRSPWARSEASSPSASESKSRLRRESAIRSAAASLIASSSVRPSTHSARTMSIQLPCPEMSYTNSSAGR